MDLFGNRVITGEHLKEMRCSETVMISRGNIEFKVDLAKQRSYSKKKGVECGFLEVSSETRELS